ncbi:MAG: helix-turn-helix domain-containing protein, partial [Terrimicrobiaceae bacterium]
VACKVRDLARRSPVAWPVIRVLSLLYRERGNAVSRDRIFSEIWGIEYYGTTRTLDQVIVKLRQKIEVEPSEPRHLLTVHGLGYRLEP